MSTRAVPDTVRRARAQSGRGSGAASTRSSGGGAASRQAPGQAEASAPRSAPLSALLNDAADLLGAVRAGRSLVSMLPDVPVGRRAGAHALAAHALRRMGTVDAVLRVVAPRKPTRAWVQPLLLVSLAVLDESLANGAGHGDATPTAARLPRYDAHTVVDQAVRAAAARPGGVALKGLFNGVLRRYGRERDALLAQVADEPEARWNYPAWWVAAVQAAWPAHWQSVLAAGDAAPPLALRANRRRADAAQVQAAFAQAGVAAQCVPPDAVVLARAQPVSTLPGYEQGDWSVQDLSAQRAGALLPVADGMRVLDACAAPGGKTAHLLERARLSLWALDVDADRLARVRDNLTRLGLLEDAVHLECADAAQPDIWWDGQPFDAILADVPCTASGVVRRHPDIRWLRRAADVDAMVATQRRVLSALWPLLRPGGHLLYATCSVFPAENEAQAQWLLSQHADAVRLPAPGQILPAVSAPEAPAGDGFFYALFAKAAPVVNNEGQRSPDLTP